MMKKANPLASKLWDAWELLEVQEKLGVTSLAELVKLHPTTLKREWEKVEVLFAHAAHITHLVRVLPGRCYLSMVWCLQTALLILLQMQEFPTHHECSSTLISNGDNSVVICRDDRCLTSRSCAKKQHRRSSVTRH